MINVRQPKSATFLKPSKLPNPLHPADARQLSFHSSEHQNAASLKIFKVEDKLAEKMLQFAATAGGRFVGHSRSIRVDHGSVTGHYEGLRHQRAGKFRVVQA